jgi:hypothetical protein
VYRALLRTAAILLGVATAVLLIQLGREDPRPLSPLLFARALVIGAIFHAGLFFSPDARRASQRILAAATMLPSVLVLGGIAGEAVTRLSRGMPLKVLPVITAVLGLISYVFAYYALTRRSQSLGRFANEQR